MEDMTEPNFYEAVGGEQTFRRLVGRFYAKVAEDPLLRSVYPGEDLGPAEEHLRLFLVQYWGGPRTYSEQRGHPRLRMRHVPFPIGQAERNAWLAHMRLAVQQSPAEPADAQALLDYFESASTSLINRHS